MMPCREGPTRFTPGSFEWQVMHWAKTALPLTGSPETGAPLASLMSSLMAVGLGAAGVVASAEAAALALAAEVSVALEASDEGFEQALKARAAPTARLVVTTKPRVRIDHPKSRRQGFLAEVIDLANRARAPSSRRAPGVAPTVAVV